MRPRRRARYHGTMTRDLTPHRARARRALTAVAVAAAVFGAAAPAANAGIDTPEVPASLDVQGAHKPYLRTHAAGVQIYRCDLTAGEYRWGLVAPRATLTNDAGKVVGSHGGGPTWTARDGSRIAARRYDGVTVDPTAIPWLLLQVTSTQQGDDGDRFAGTTWIQRIDTVGGLAPAPSTCDATTASTIVEVPYTADYVFWKATGG